MQEQGRDQFGGKTHVSEQDTAAVQHSVAFTKSRHLARRGCRHGCADPAPASPGSRQNAASLPSPTSRLAPSARRADPSTKAGERAEMEKWGQVLQNDILTLEKWGQVLQNDILTLIHCVEQHSSSFHREPRDIRRSVSSCSPLIGKRQPSPSFDPGPAHSHPVDVPALDIAVVGPV